MQLSRPYMLVLGVVVALAAMWMLVLRPHNQNGSSGGPSAPGVNGLAHDVVKARGAAALSNQANAQLAQNADAASNPHPSTTPATAGAAAGPSAPAQPASRPVVQPSGAKAPGPAVKPAPARPAPVDHAAQVSQSMQQGKVAVVLFWNPEGADDRAVMRQLSSVSGHDGDVVVLEAQPSDVASFGAVTRGVQITETPTTLVIDKHGEATALTGLTDSTSITQAIGDAERGAANAQAPSLSAWKPGSSRSLFIARANALCHQQLRANGASAAVVGQLRALPAPAADRATLDGYYASFDRAVSETAAGSGKTATARNLRLQGQTDFDYAAQGLADYGLTACFSAESRTI